MVKGGKQNKTQWHRSKTSSQVRTTTIQMQHSGTQKILHALLHSLHPYAMPHVYDFLPSDEPKQRVSEKINLLKPEISVMKVMIEAELRVLDA